MQNILLKLARVKADLTVNELAKKLEMSRYAIYNYEKGERYMPMDKFIELVKVTEMTDEEIIKIIRS